MNLPEPHYKIGDKVRVIPSESNSEFFSAVEKIVWHYKDETYNYYLAGKSKRYVESDLEAIK